MTLSVSLSHCLGDLEVDIAFDAPPGVTALFGHSGAGKTTVVNAVAGLLRPDGGRVSVEDWVLFDTEKRHWLPPHRRRLGYIFQEARLFPHLTVRQNLLFGRWFAPRAAQTAKPERIIDMLGIGPLLNRRPGGLSGGEKQRVAIGRALLSAPKLILADEPLAALDAARKEEILPYFERLRDEVEIPILYVSHSMAEVARLATTVVVLDRGKVVRAGPTAAVLSDPSAAPGIGPRELGAVLSARVLCHHADGLSELQTDGGRLFLPRIDAAPGSAMRIRIAAQDVILSRTRPEGLSALNMLKGTIADIREGTGPGTLIRLRLGDQDLLARITRRSANAMGLSPGQACYAIVKTVSVAQGDIGRG